MSDTQAQRAGWALVGGQFLLLAGLAGEVVRGLRVRRRAARLVVGGALFAAGACMVAGGSRRLGPALRAHPAPAERATLRVDGPYALVRHPIYSGVLLCAGGGALAAGTGRALAWWASLVALFNVKARLEERLLARRFAEYEAYTRCTPRFVPRLPLAVRALVSLCPWRPR